MPNTDQIEVVTQAVVDRLRTAASVAAIGLRDADDVAYGDQKLIPRTPYVTVESGSLERSIAGIGGKGQTLNDFTVYILAYTSKVQSNQENRKQSDALSTTIVRQLEDDIKFGELLIHSHVQRIEPGFTTRSGDLMRTVRLTWVGQSKTMIT